MDNIFNLSGKYQALWSKLKTPFPLSWESIRNASHQHGYAGALLRQQKAVAKLLEGKLVNIVVLGGSMTWGAECPTNWPKRLGELFRELGYDVTVTNLAEHGTTSEWAAHQVHAWLRAGLAEADIVIMDYSINDDASTPKQGGGIMDGPAYVRRAFKDLVALLASLPSKPAVMTTESVHIGMWCSRMFKGYRCGHCSTDVKEYYHWDAAKELEVPVFYYPAAVCASGSMHWYDEKGSQAHEAHPGSMTHDLFARAVLGSFLLQAKGVCDHGLTGVDFQPMRPSLETLCLSQPINSYNANDGESSFAPVARSGSWTFGEDVDGKPGWLASADGHSSEISFPITTKAGWVHVEFLGSHTSELFGGRFTIGTVEVWLDGNNSDVPCELDGSTASAASMPMYELMKVEPPAGPHTLHFRSDGRKFKLLGIYTC